jgi:hypothetical protein
MHRAVAEGLRLGAQDGGYIAEKAVTSFPRCERPSGCVNEVQLSVG